MHDSRSNSDKLDKISFPKMLTRFSKITLALFNNFILFRTAKSVNVRFIPHVFRLFNVISIQSYDVTMYVCFARVLPAECHLSVDIFTLTDGST